MFEKYKIYETGKAYVNNGTRYKRAPAAGTSHDCNLFVIVLKYEYK